MVDNTHKDLKIQDYFRIISLVKEIKVEINVISKTFLKVSNSNLTFLNNQEIF